VSDEPRALDGTELVTTSVGDPYPEDSTPSEREFEPLKLPLSRRCSRAGPSRGVAIGVMPARALHDLAATATVMEALKFQRLRRRHRLHAPQGRLLLSPRDLRAYRRIPPVDRLLVLVLDHTCRGAWDWTNALMPYLRWAYFERAGVGIVQVGANSAPDSLRAEQTLVRSVLTRGLGSRLDAAPGRATPLAHGLELALRTLRHGLHHGREGILDALLVVVTDGRGNVPRDASRGAPLERPVAAAGVEDALAVAQEIGRLQRLRSVVVDPQPAWYPDLPGSLAAALQAELVAGRSDAF